MELKGPIWLMQPIPYFGEELKGKWIYEPKIDGWRLQIIHYKTGKLELWGRRLEKNPNWTFKLINLVKAIKDNNLPKGLLLDCELYTNKGRRFIPSLFKQQIPKDVVPIILVFDIVFYEDEFIGKLSLIQRKSIIQGLNLKPPLYVMEYKELKETKLINFGKAYEGIIFKREDSLYQVVQDGPIATESWRKLKF
jgi:ATP-dependent DNA ligase